MNTKAAIFDMDGVLVNNMDYHRLAFIKFCDKYKITITDNDFKYFIFGRTNDVIMTFLFKRTLSSEEIAFYDEEKEAMYREIYKPDIQPTPGLEKFLTDLKANGFALAVGTSAPTANLDFVLDTLKLRHYFDQTIDASQVKKGKPDPEVYIKSGQALQLDPKDCVVFEDSVAGIEAANRASMNVIGLATTHKNLQGTSFNIPNFENINAEKVMELLNKNKVNTQETVK